jgi:hypothetical protein
MGLLDLFRGGSGEQDPYGYDGPSKLGIALMIAGNAASNLAAGRGGVDPGMLALAQHGKDSKRKYDLRMRYADKLEKTDPEKAEMVRSGVVDVGDIIGLDMKNKAAVELEKLKFDLDPKNQFLKKIMGGSTATSTPAPDGSFTVVPMPTGDTATGSMPAPPGSENTQVAQAQPGVNPYMVQASGIPDLTPAESRMLEAAAAYGNFDVGLRQVMEQRDITRRQTTEQDIKAKQDSINNAENLAARYDKDTAPERIAIDVAQQISQLAGDIPNMTGAEKVAATYRFVKLLDQLGAVREGDIAMVQSAAPVLDNLLNLKNVVLEGSPASDAAIADIANTMGKMGGIAREALTRKQLELQDVARSREIDPSMVIPDRANRAVPGYFRVDDMKSDRPIPRAADGGGTPRPKRWNPKTQSFE